MGSYLIEFSGLPGSGKSTLSNYLIEYLKHEDYNLITEKDIFTDSKKIGKVYGLFLAFFNRRNFILNWELVKLGLKLSLKNFSFYPIITSNKIIRYNNVIWKSYNRENCLIILSEGNIQYISTIFDNLEYSNSDIVNTIFNKLDKIYNNMIYISCNIDSHIALKRISNRTSEPNSIDCMQKHELEIFMNNRSKNLEQILSNRKKTNLFSLDMNEEITTNLNLLIAKLTRKKIL